MRTEPPNPVPRRILVVDDSRSQRLLLVARLVKWGYQVTQAADGAEALAMLRADPVPMVLSDWMMPGLTGPDLCRALRQEQQDSYTYFILLTSKQDKQDVSDGLSAGADDFLSKPVDESELAARLKAGLRLIDMQAHLVAQKAEAERAYTEVRALYETMENDLRAASVLQRAVIPASYAQCNDAEVAVYYQPSGHVGGDLVGYFPVGDHAIGVYCIDVSGHGVSSSLLTIRLAQFFNPTDQAGNIAFARQADGRFAIRPPEEVVADLNARFVVGEVHDLYFTMAYAVLDLTTGHGSLCQAGHPHPAVLRADGSVIFVGEGGPPVGMLPGVTFTSTPIQLHPGDRLLMYSDGIVEAELPEGGMIDDAGLVALVADHRDADVAELLPRLMNRLCATTASLVFTDDISALVVALPGDRPQPVARKIA